MGVRGVCVRERGGRGGYVQYLLLHHIVYYLCHHVFLLQLIEAIYNSTCRFDMSKANLNDSNLDKMKAADIPDVVGEYCHSY